MSIYKGIFWYVPGEHKLIAVKVACDENGKATIFFNPVLNRFDIHDLIMAEFELVRKRIIVKEVADGSKHYEYLIDFESTALM